MKGEKEKIYIYIYVYEETNLKILRQLNIFIIQKKYKQGYNIV